MTHDRIGELLSPFLEDAALSSTQLAQIASYTDLLLKWNAYINLTAVRDPEEIITRHFGESLFAARQLISADAEGRTAIDIGSGAGFPGLPFKIWNERLNLTLIEAHQKKAVFLREVLRALGFSGVKVFADRAENLSNQAELVVLRAVERFERILPVAASFVSPDGRLALLIGENQVEAAKAILDQAILGQAKWGSPLAIPMARARKLLVGRLPS